MAVEALIGKLNSQAIAKVVDKAGESATSPQGKTSFKQVLDAATVEGKEFAEMLGMAEVDGEPARQLGAVSAVDVGYTPSADIIGVGKPEGGQTVVNLLAEVNKGQLQMDSLVNHVMYSGKRFSNQELLVIQAHVFHYAQMTELTVKVAEQGVSSAKSVLNTQIQ